MGLGLVCLAERIKALGGTYGANLRTDMLNGTVIWFKIPFDHADSNDRLISRRSVSSMDTPDDYKLRSQDPVVSGLSILIVDDSVTILKMMSFIILKAGAKVVLAKNGREAVEKTKEFKFDVIITDIQMPVMDGYRATKEIREWERFHSIKPKIIIGEWSGVKHTKAVSSFLQVTLFPPILCLTLASISSHLLLFTLNFLLFPFSFYSSLSGISACTDAERCEEALQTGMDGFLIKPFRLIDLVSIISDYKHTEKMRNLQNYENKIFVDESQ